MRIDNNNNDDDDDDDNDDDDDDDVNHSEDRENLKLLGRSKDPQILTLRNVRRDGWLL